MMANKQVLIIGAGVIGLSIANYLQDRDYQLTIIDSQDPGAASPAAAGVLFPTSVSRSAGLAGQHSLTAVDLWPSWAEHLGAGLLTSGGITFFADENGVDQLRQLADNVSASELLQPFSTRGHHGLPYLTAAARQETAAVLHLPQGRSLDPRKLLARLRERYRGQLLTDQVDQLLTSGSRVTGVRTKNGNNYQSDTVILAPGASEISWLPGQLSVPIISLAGEALFLKTDLYHSIPAAIYPFEAGPLVPRPGGVWLGGSYRREEGASEPLLSSLEAIISRGREIFHGLDQARVANIYYGRRPISPDGRPFIGPSAELSGLYWATGHGKDGLLHSALVGQQIAGWLENDSGPEELLPSREIIA